MLVVDQRQTNGARVLTPLQLGSLMENARGDLCALFKGLIKNVQLGVTCSNFRPWGDTKKRLSYKTLSKFGGCQILCDKACKLELGDLCNNTSAVNSGGV